VEEQREFFQRGVSGLRPMTLQTIARRLGLHESTVARVAAGKYVQTPRGIFPIKFFFSGGVATRAGEAASNRAVRERVRSLIAEEDKSRPRSDREIAEILKEAGFRIARRTVAKYRESLKIERSQFRRREAAGPCGLAAAGSGGEGH
jgi:RNA polymerase sigma-54 factor